MMQRASRIPTIRGAAESAPPDVFATPATRSRIGGPADVFAAPAVPTGIDAAEIMASVNEAAYEWNITTDQLLWSDNAAELLGTRSAIETGRAFAALLHAETASARFDAVMKSTDRDTGKGVAYRVRYSLRPEGSERRLWIEDSGRWFAGADGRPQRAHGIIRAVDANHARGWELADLSRFDPVSGEMNRARFAAALEESIRAAVGVPGRSCGLLLIAIDHLPRLNELYGFNVADEVIRAVAQRLRSKMRSGDQIGRFSGDKFAVILKDCSPEDLERAADRFIAVVRDDMIRSSAGPIAATVTIGGVTAPRYARSVEELLTRAQEALDGAKRRRHGSFRAFRPNPEREAMRRDNVRAAGEIVSALNERRILLAFEPVVEAASREPAFYEGLMRIRRADGTIATANSIVPVAERLGLVRLLDHRVLEILIGEMVAVPTLRASINVSSASIADPDWWAALDALLRAHAGVGERLTLEMTETAAIDDIEETRGFVSRAKHLGCRIAIDNFGAGYTSFRNLRKLGADLLKIDGSYVQNLTRSEDDRAFARTLIDLAKRLGIATVAERVQDEAAAAMLTQWGCDYLQGAFIALGSVERPWGDVAPVDRRKARRD